MFVEKYRGTNIVNADTGSESHTSTSLITNTGTRFTTRQTGKPKFLLDEVTTTTSSTNSGSRKTTSASAVKKRKEVFKHVPLDFSSLSNSFIPSNTTVTIPNYGNWFNFKILVTHSDNIPYYCFISGHGNKTSFTASQPDFIKALSEFTGTISGAINKSTSSIVSSISEAAAKEKSNLSTQSDLEKALAQAEASKAAFYDAQMRLLEGDRIQQDLETRCLLYSILIITTYLTFF